MGFNKLIKEEGDGPAGFLAADMESTTTMRHEGQAADHERKGLPTDMEPLDDTPKLLSCADSTCSENKVATPAKTAILKRSASDLVADELAGNRKLSRKASFINEISSGDDTPALGLARPVAVPRVLTVRSQATRVRQSRSVMKCDASA